MRPNRGETCQASRQTAPGGIDYTDADDRQSISEFICPWIPLHVSGAFGDVIHTHKKDQLGKRETRPHHLAQGAAYHGTQCSVHKTILGLVRPEPETGSIFPTIP